MHRRPNKRLWQMDEIGACEDINGKWRMPRWIRTDEKARQLVSILNRCDETDNNLFHCVSKDLLRFNDARPADTLPKRSRTIVSDLLQTLESMLADDGYSRRRPTRLPGLGLGGA